MASEIERIDTLLSRCHRLRNEWITEELGDSVVASFVRNIARNSAANIVQRMIAPDDCFPRTAIPRLWNSMRSLGGAVPEEPRSVNSDADGLRALDTAVLWLTTKRAWLQPATPVKSAVDSERDSDKKRNQPFGPMYIGRHGSFRLMAVMTDLDAQMVKPDDVADVEFTVCDERDQDTELFRGRLPVKETVLSVPETNCWNGDGGYGGYNFRWDVPAKTFPNPKIPYLLRFIVTLKSGMISSGLAFRIRATDPPIHTNPEVVVDGPIPPKSIQWNGRLHPIPPTPWQLANYMWHRDKAAETDVCLAVWNDQVKSSTLKTNISRANDALRKARVPRILRQENGWVIWKMLQ
ncbi:MAG: hypothetical protein HY290_08125 [Planctomycetia bacterium]|nr:hypothetical protein [Planctomycetia bacterium]